MMTLRFGIITCPTVQSIQMTTLLFLVQIDASGMFLNWRKRHLAIKSVFFLNNMTLTCWVASHSWNAVRITHTAPTTCFFYGGVHGTTWDGGLFIVILLALSLPLLFPLLSYRKHALNCHRMKPALFSVLCEIKEKTGEFLLHSVSLYSPLCTGWSLVLRYSAPFSPVIVSLARSHSFIGLTKNSIDWILIVFVVELIALVQAHSKYALLFVILA